MAETESPLFDVHDIIRIKDDVQWSWRELKKILPDQITDEHINYAQPIGKVAEIEKIYVKKVQNDEVRIYLLRFTSDHYLEVQDQFMAQCVHHIDKRTFEGDDSQEPKEDTDKAESLLEVFEDLDK